jgi:hypothetical protein
MQTDTSMTTDRTPINPEATAITAVSKPSSRTLGYERQARNVPFPEKQNIGYKSGR